MLNRIFQLIKPKNISIKYEEVNLNENRVFVKPNYMAVCHADQRYFQGKRDPKVLAKKLPMALIHESSGIVVADPTGNFNVGQKVVVIPNQPPKPSNNEFFENYYSGTFFRSSGFDGFMQEVVSLPVDRVVSYEGIDDEVAAITEFVSVAMHAINRFKIVSHSKRDEVLIIGDGSLAFVVATSLKYLFPDMKLYVIGRHTEKLQLFNFVEKTFLSNEIPDDFSVDHAFECTGGEGSEYAINDIISYIRPQGTVILMGVSENKVAINTRDVLEKGLLLVGSSRSGRIDFQNAIEMMENQRIQNRLKNILYLDDKVEEVDDIYRVFSTDLSTPFKTVFKWDV